LKDSVNASLDSLEIKDEHTDSSDLHICHGAVT
jgi:hypothetical protein